MVNVDHKESLKAVTMLPSLALKQVFTNKAMGNNFSEEAIAKENLLSVEEVNIWLNHLNTLLCNRKRGAAKAALTIWNSVTCSNCCNNGKYASLCWLWP